MDEERERVKYGTYSVMLTAGSWSRILVAVGAMRDEYARMGFHGLAEDCERTLYGLRSQVLESA